MQDSHCFAFTDSTHPETWYSLEKHTPPFQFPLHIVWMRLTPSLPISTSRHLTHAGSIRACSYGDSHTGRQVVPPTQMRFSSGTLHRAFFQLILLSWMKEATAAGGHCGRKTCPTMKHAKERGKRWRETYPGTSKHRHLIMTDVG